MPLHGPKTVLISSTSLWKSSRGSGEPRAESCIDGGFEVGGDTERYWDAIFEVRMESNVSCGVLKYKLRGGNVIYVCIVAGSSTSRSRRKRNNFHER